MHTKIALIGFALVVTLALAGCGSKQPAAVSESETPALASATEPADTATTAPEGKPTVVVQPTEVAVEAEATAEAPLELNDRTAGLDKLSSYRLSWSATWEGEENGKPSTANWEWTQEVTTEPPAQHMIFSGAGSDETQAGAFEMFSIGNTRYIISGGAGNERKCMSMTSEDMNDGTDAFNPSSLGSLNDARYAGTETVNGIATRRYTYDEKAMPLLGSRKVAGQMWVATDGGYVVKETVQWEGGAGFLGSTEGTGKGQWTWELHDVNTRFTITPPEGCESPADDLPVMADATDKTSLGEMLMYKTASTLDEVAEFYRTEMATAGWTPEGEPTKMDQYVQMSFSKDSRTAQVMITSGDDGNQVIINVTEPDAQ